MNEETIKSACMTHGAKAIYEAACKRMEGSRDALAFYGLAIETIADANIIASVAFQFLDPNTKAADLASASIEAAKL